MKRWLFILLAFLLAACASPATPEQSMPSDYTDLGPAPELSGDVWLNTDTPLRLAGLRGQVVLVEMWTFG